MTLLEYHTADANVRMLDQKTKEAMKVATKLLAKSSRLPPGDKNKLGRNAITNSVNKKYSVALSSRSVARYVQNGLIGESPIKRGVVGYTPPKVMKLLEGAFITYKKLEQIESKDKKERKLSKAIIENLNSFFCQ